MTHVTQLACRCGCVRLEVDGDPIITAECHCDSCRSAALRLETLADARPLLEPNGGTGFVLFRKDRVRFLAGSATLKEHRLTPKSGTRRVVATCCNTPIFLEFQAGHWLSLYAALWPAGARPALEVRTMTSDRAPSTPLADDVPNANRQSFSFMRKLLWAWIAMGFRAPKVEAVQGGVLHV
jgi:hypothetical protein